MPLLEKLFGFDARTMTVRTELVAGLTTFMTMCYILAVNPALNGINTILASAELNRLAHRYSKGSDLFHHVKFRLFCVVLCNIGNTQKIPCAVFVGNTVFFITRPAFVYWFFRYKIHIFSP